MGKIFYAAMACAIGLFVWWAGPSYRAVPFFREKSPRGEFELVFYCRSSWPPHPFVHAGYVCLYRLDGNGKRKLLNQAVFEGGMDAIRTTWDEEGVLIVSVGLWPLPRQ